ncbi:P-loop containing nucleoside triphosphate hydrolase protein [Lipomyces tetrasporus]|uniref:P-loop containing nucleoside triphosphate hydrolase protein n=1 Tax=Lipomyces tetrasporus TaxID=54092 RepID=A0AAD7QMF2_9ASCO|nr:P-loop containing nucleoside triphosphate hydrolase protein [Lipomyces tetrasporus]KAJ8098007.1 P-loop containing nucleoside triphosphate hydrolase protein [Lipomyces tetrasporus]
MRLRLTFGRYFVYLGLADMVLSYISIYTFIDRGQILAGRIREHYLTATLKQNIGYFDKLGSGEVTTRIASDTTLIQEGISEKVCYVLSNLSTFVMVFILAFTRMYILAFMMTSIAAVVVASFFISSGLMKKYFKKSMDGYSVGGTLAEETISSIRNVQAFSIQDRLAAQYDKFLEVSEHWGIRAGLSLGIMTSLVWFGCFNNDALAFWQGTRFIRSGQATVGQVISILLLMNQGTLALSAISPHFRSITSAVAAASKIFATIDRESVVDSSSDQGIKLTAVRGDIELKDVKFIYPSRPNVTILNNFHLKIPAGKTVALVGASGSGKSTIIGLLERFYLPVGGEVLFDGVNIEDLNVRWLRQQIALVSQEPTLFACSIYENIAHGLIGTKYENASEIEKRELVVEACKQANAMAFIETFPEGLDTNVGERGFLMSGGQKQRIAIARAIVSNPRILLLDEATSALDTKSEGIVQDALDRAAKNRTTIVIAHRLSTIKDADLIVVMKKGVIKEMGTHNELLQAQGEYYDLVEMQKIEKQKKELAVQDQAASDDEPDEKAEFLEDSVLGLARSKTTTSVSSMVIANTPMEEEIDDSKYSTWELFVFLTKLSARENGVNILASFLSLINGLGFVALGFFYGAAVEAYTHIPDFDYVNSEINKYAGLFFMLSIVVSMATSGSQALFSYASQKLVRRIRYLTFRQILRQDIEFFDRDENTTGGLTTMLSQGAQAIEGLTGATFGQIMNSVMIILSGSLVSLIITWKLGLVCISTMPILIGGAFFRLWILAQFQGNMKNANQQANSYACESATAIRTVLSLTREKDVLEKYHRNIDEQHRISRPATNKSAILYGISQGTQFLIYGLAYWYGSTFIRTGEYTVLQFYIAYITLIIGAQNAGMVLSYAPDMGKAKYAAANIKKLLSTVPKVDTSSNKGKVPEDVQGEIEFRNVHFRYPTRLQVPVLRGLNLTIKKGQYVALVGSSGCGKSTTIGLIEAFYRPLSGQILLDGQDISELNINAYREQIALVQQEPTLYAGTIRDNILYGTKENVSDDQIYDVCREANIHDYIMSLPDGYDTLCGSKGTLLSGGQKQRIAIARALIRQPKVLLLDEATSALDSESEKIVQAALDAAAKGRTTIAIAHRLSTIQNADVIYVFENGKVLESGTHQGLLAKRTKYYELVQLQALENTA